MDIRSIFKVVKIKLCNRDSHIHFISGVNDIKSDMLEQQHINASNTHDVKAPSMVGPTWTRVCLTLGSDCLPTLFQETALPLSRVSWTAYCSHAHDSMIWVIQGCISTSHLSMSPWGLFHTSYSVGLHGTSYPMMDNYVYDWRRVLQPASADALQVSLQFHY